MSEPIAHMAVADDCRRLALESERICDSFKRVLSEHHWPMRLGSMTRSGGTYMVPLLEKYRDGVPDERAEKRLAFVLGWIAHRAADRFYKTIYRQLDPEAEKTHNIRIYHDLVLYERVYGDGAEEPFVPGVLEASIDSQPGSAALDVGSVEHLFGAKWLQDMLALHSFVGAEDDPEDWIETALSRRQYYRLDHQGAYESPDPEKMERFVADAEFYDPGDAVIELARSIQRGSPAPSIAVERAVEEAITGSQYARSLNLGFAYLRAASEYVDGAIDREMLEYRLHRSPMGLIADEFGGGERSDPATKMEHPSPGEPVPPGRITAIAVTDDCYRLAEASEAVSEPIADSLARHPDAARIAGVLPSPDEQLPGLLRALRDRWPDEEAVTLADVVDAGIDPEFVAFLSGALCHVAAEAQFGGDTRERRLHHDVTVLRAFGERPPDGADTGAIADLLECFWLRSLVGLHTLVPDRDDVEGWMDRLFDWTAGDERMRRRYAEAYAALDDETDPECYDRSDRIIEAARAVREGSTDSIDPEAITATPTSRYGAAVRDGYRNIAAMGEFLRGTKGIDAVLGRVP